MNEVIEFNNLNDIKSVIKAELQNLADGCIAIGYYLKQARDKELFAEDGYEDIFLFAKEEFNLGRSSVYTYMGINDKFSQGGNSLKIDADYKGYGSSKLAEMLTLTDEQLQIVTPDATVKEIREFKKNTSENDDENSSPDVWTNTENTKEEDDSEHEKNGLEKFVDNYFKIDGKSIFEKVISTILSTSGDREEKIMYVFAPSKFKSFKIPRINVIFNAEGIHIMELAKGNKSFTYANLLETLKNMFNPAAGESAEAVYKRYYNEPLIEHVKEKVEPVKVKVEIKEVPEQLPGQVNIDDIPEVRLDQIEDKEDNYEEEEEDQKEEQEDEESIEDAKEEQEEDSKETAAEEEENCYLKKIDELELSVRTFNLLKKAGINTINDICEYSENKLAEIHNLSHKNIEEIVEKLLDIGLSLEQENKSVESELAAEQEKCVKEDISEEDTAEKQESAKEELEAEVIQTEGINQAAEQSEINNAIDKLKGLEFTIGNASTLKRPLQIAIKALEYCLSHDDFNYKKAEEICCQSCDALIARKMKNDGIEYFCTGKGKLIFKKDLDAERNIDNECKKYYIKK